MGHRGFTRHGQEHLTKLAREIIADDERYMPSNNRHGQEHLTKLAREIIADDERLYAQQQSDDPDS